MNVFVDYYQDRESKLLRHDLFYKDAEKIADCIKGRMKGRMKYTQVRKFYNQTLIHKKKIEEKGSSPEVFKKELPYIKMLVTKAKYANARNKVSDEFVKFIDTYIGGKTKDKEDFFLFCDLFEAVMAYLKTMLKNR